MVLACGRKLLDNGQGARMSVTDHSERVDGPSLIVLAGDASPTNEYRLGTRDYDWHSHRRGQLLDRLRRHGIEPAR